MTLLLKDPDAVLDYSIDWGAEYLGAGDLLAQSDWSVIPDEAESVTIDGMAAYEKSSGSWAVYRAGAWELGNVRGSKLVIGGLQVVGSRATAIADPTGGSTADSQARAAIGQILAALRQHGLIET
jgi:hypothetical protein